MPDQLQLAQSYGANFCLTTACEKSGLPKAMRWFAHLKKLQSQTSATRWKEAHALQTFFDYQSLRPRADADNHPALVVKVTENDPSFHRLPPRACRPREHGLYQK